jgi:hypothetical protein
MIPTNITNHSFLTHIIASNVECLVLLHSPIIIDFKKLGTILKNCTMITSMMILPLKKLTNISSALSLSLDAFLSRNKIHSLGYMKLSSMECLENLID